MTRPSHVPSLDEAVASLEAFLGDPRDPESTFSHALALEYDERSAYPHPEIALLRQWGLQEWFVPAEYGGKAVNVEDGGHLIRMVARRDITAATAMSINAIAYTALWAGARDEQKAEYADRLLCGSRLAWALSERTHGSDLLANETRAVKTDNGWVINGEKWLIGNATLSDVVVLLARTSDRDGPAAHSLFVIDRRKFPATQLADLPNEPPVGLRGFDLSGFAFNDCLVPDDALVGCVGRGLELVLKASQMARINLNFLALGALDTGLRLALDFAREREIFGGTVWEIPYSRTQLVESFADLLAMDAFTTAAVRALQIAPDQISSWSSMAKYLVPTVVAEAMPRTAVVLGARHFLRTGPWAIFQKMARDLVVTDFADGNTVVNLKNIVAQLDQGLNGLLSDDDLQQQAAQDRVAAIFGLGDDLPAYAPGKQALFSRRPDDVLVALPDTIAALEARGGDWVRVADLGRVVLQRCDQARLALDRLKTEHGSTYTNTNAAFDLAKDHCHLVAAGSWLHLQRYAAQRGHPLVNVPALAALIVSRLLRRGGTAPQPTPEDVEVAAQALEALHDAGQLFTQRAPTLGRSLECAA